MTEKSQDVVDTATGRFATNIVYVLHLLRIVRNVANGKWGRGANDENMALLFLLSDVFQLGIVHLVALLHSPNNSGIAE